MIFFLKLCPGWFVSALDACGNFGGTLVGWNPLLADLKAYHSCAGLLLKGRIKGFIDPIHLLNIYGLYSHRGSFWDCAKEFGLLYLPNFFLVGDLNFTWYADEAWGCGRSIDQFFDYFHTLFDEAILVDAEPGILTPTWFNGQNGGAGITKCIDRFLLLFLIPYVIIWGNIEVGTYPLVFLTIRPLSYNWTSIRAKICTL